MRLRALPLVIAIPLATLALQGRSDAAGACCSVIQGISNVPSISLIRSSAKSHEMLQTDHYDLKQDGVVLKANYPVSEKFSLQGQFGYPTSTTLSNHGDSIHHHGHSHHGTEAISGSGGLIYGMGVGYQLPDIGDVSLQSSVSMNRSRGVMNKSSDGIPADQTFQISEIKLLLTGTVSLSERIDLYAGMGFNSEKNQLKDRIAGVTSHGEREGHITPLLGVRGKMSDRAFFVVEAGFGHSRTVSAGVMAPL